MKILLYTEGQKSLGKSGLGKAIKHQQRALEYEGIDYTLDPNDDYDILHINTMLILRKKIIRMVLFCLNRHRNYLKNYLLNLIHRVILSSRQLHILRSF